MHSVNSSSVEVFRQASNCFGDIRMAVAIQISKEETWEWGKWRSFSKMLNTRDEVGHSFTLIHQVSWSSHWIKVITPIDSMNQNEQVALCIARIEKPFLGVVTMLSPFSKRLTVFSVLIVSIPPFIVCLLDYTWIQGVNMDEKVVKRARWTCTYGSCHRLLEELS
jgi:hypothetical protein